MVVSPPGVSALSKDIYDAAYNAIKTHLDGVGDWRVATGSVKDFESGALFPAVLFPGNVNS
jgi:hypothetical protein